MIRFPQKTRATLSRLFALSFLISSLYATVANSQENPLKPFTANYLLTKKNVAIAQVKFELTENNGQWLYKSSAEAAGLAAMFSSDSISESVRFELHEGKIRPLNYRYTRDSKKAAKQVEADFDWVKNSVSIRHNDKTASVALKPCMVDQLSVQLALMIDLQSGELQETYTVLDGVETKEMTFTGPVLENTNINSKNYNSLKLTRSHGSRETITWHAKELGYLPVKIRRLRKGKLKTQLELTAFSWLKP